MRVITIQSKEVLMILKKYGKYTVPNNAPVTTQFLLSKWVVDIKEINDNFIDNYVDTGGINILKPLNFI